MKYTLDDTFKKQLVLASKKLDNDLILQKPATMSRPPDRTQLNISTQDLFRIRKK